MAAHHARARDSVEDAVRVSLTFLLRGLDNVRGEWSLVTMAWNVKRMFALKAA
jgi:hypothetical protein